MLTMEKIKNMTKEELLELYANKVRCDHYDPCNTPLDMVELYNSGISQDDLMEEILSRMN